MGRELAILFDKWAVYEGAVDAHYLHTGNGILHTEDGDEYQGSYKLGRISGYGVYKWSNGSNYIGTYENDNRHGQGRFTYANGDIYEGGYKDDKVHGLGRFTWAEGHYKIGQYESGSLVGVHKCYSKKDELLSIRTYENNELVSEEMVEND
ncbi:hypothetical protein FGO68_gene8824 [Halteria grandinella]|uniref:MORN repeat protein n=1 Tax=Halteria grandinella TaxID=5974 RepID=A0A8J8NTF8_HALGN|nr:hypothetical protein FGO68_gene8824 [Halteria grandinella]